MKHNSIDSSNLIKRLLKISLFSCLVVQLYACQEEVKEEVDTQRNQFQRNIKHSLPDSLLKGSSYLSVYSQVYNETEHKTYNLTATVSIRNVNSNDTIILIMQNILTQGGML